MDFLTNENVISLLKFIGKVITAIGVFTIIQGFLYFNIGTDYESITLKEYPNETTNESLYKEGYDVIEFIDLDKNNKGIDHKKYLIGPENRQMTDITFQQFNGDVSNTGIASFDEMKDTKLHTNKLKPQQYILVRVPTTTNIPINKITFSIDYQTGEYEFTSNMRSGLNDKVTLEVKRTLMSFLAK